MNEEVQKIPPSDKEEYYISPHDYIKNLSSQPNNPTTPISETIKKKRSLWAGIFRFPQKIFQEITHTFSPYRPRIKKMKGKYVFLDSTDAILTHISSPFSGLKDIFTGLLYITSSPFIPKASMQRKTGWMTEGIIRTIGGTLRFGLGFFTLVFTVPLKLAITALNKKEKIEESEWIKKLILKFQHETDFERQDKLRQEFYLKFKIALQNNQKTNLLINSQKFDFFINTFKLNSKKLIYLIKNKNLPESHDLSNLFELKIKNQTITNKLTSISLKRAKNNKKIYQTSDMPLWYILVGALTVAPSILGLLAGVVVTAFFPPIGILILAVSGFLLLANAAFALSIYFRNKYYKHVNQELQNLDIKLMNEQSIIENLEDAGLESSLEYDQPNSTLKVSEAFFTECSTAYIIDLLKKDNIKNLEIITHAVYTSTDKYKEKLIHTKESIINTHSKKLSDVGAQLKQNNINPKTGRKPLTANLTHNDTTQVWLCLEETLKNNDCFGALRDCFFNKDHGILQQEYSYITFNNSSPTPGNVKS